MSLSVAAAATLLKRFAGSNRVMFCDRICYPDTIMSVLFLEFIDVEFGLGHVFVKFACVTKRFQMLFNLFHQVFSLHQQIHIFDRARAARIYIYVPLDSLKEITPVGTV